MEIDAENVNYLISRCILLENRNSRQDKRIKGFEQYIEVHDERIKELEHQLKHKDERIKELEELNKELEITEKARVKWKERCELKEGLLNIELAHSKTNSRRIKELEEKLEEAHPRNDEALAYQPLTEEDLNYLKAKADDMSQSNEE